MRDILPFAVVCFVLGVTGIAIFAHLIIAASVGTFSGQCSKAGYEGAELELCIKRLKEGLPVYKENIEKWNKGY